MQTEEYEKLFRLESDYWWFVGRRRLARRLLGSAKPDARSLLDLGCGTGAGLAEAPGDWTAVGLDASRDALGYCGQRGLTRLVHGVGERLPFRDRSFDALVALDVFEHIPDDRAAFAEAHRVLKPGGALVLSVPAFSFLWGPHDVALHHHRRYTASQIRARLSEAGFQVEALSYAIFFLFPAVLASRLLERGRPGPPRASLPRVPGWLNQALIRHLEAEGALVSSRWTSLPWGSSVVATARRP